MEKSDISVIAFRNSIISVDLRWVEGVVASFAVHHRLWEASL
jgi:hypothetical protein